MTKTSFCNDVSQLKEHDSMNFLMTLFFKLKFLAISPVVRFSGLASTPAAS